MNPTFTVLQLHRDGDYPVAKGLTDSESFEFMRTAPTCMRRQKEGISQMRWFLKKGEDHQ